MRKFAYLLIVFLLVSIIFLGGSLVLDNQKGKGALQVTANTSTQIFLDGNFIGKTPLCLCDLQKLLTTGEYSLKLIPDDKKYQNFQQKIVINKGILTVVDRSFQENPGFSSGSLVTFSPISENNAEILIISSPLGAKVILDNSEMGVTPLLLSDVTPSDHELKILKDGYAEKTVKIKTLIGKKLEANIILAISSQENSQASASANKVVILDTPTGYLRVRKSNSVESEQIATVNPGDKLDLISEKDDWYQIRLENGVTGWISNAYAKKQ